MMMMMTCESVEENVTDDRYQVKCHAYYPTGSENEGEDVMEFTDVGLKVTYVEEKESNMHYMARVFSITDTEVPILFSSMNLYSTRDTKRF